MITLFKSNETDFTHNGIGSLSKNITNAVVEEELNGLYSFVFKYPIFAPYGADIDGQSILRVPTPDGNQLFRVYNPVKSMGYLTIKAYHIFYDLVDNFIEDTNIVGKNGQGAIAQLGGATQFGHSFRFFSDIETVANARMVRMNPVAALIDNGTSNTFVSRWGGELKRNNFDVRMNKSIGSNRGKKIRHRKDLVGYEADIDWSTAVTRIMPKGFDGLLLPEKYVDSPLIKYYVHPKIKMIEYSEIKAAVGEYANDEDAVPLETAYQLLREAAKEEYSIYKMDIPEATYKVDYVNLEQTFEYKDLQELQKVFLGDTVTVIHEEDGLNIEAKVISYKYDPVLKRYSELKLGSFKETFSSTYSDITNLTRKVTELIQTTNYVQSTADGKNTINRGTSEPLNPNVNDLWYKSNGSETELWQYVDENGIIYWKMISSTAELNSVKKEVTAVIEQANLDREKAEQDVETAKQAAKDYTELKANEFNDQLEIVRADVVDISSNANEAISKADKAIEDVGFMRVDVDITKANAIDALTKAQTATESFNTLSTSFDELTQTVGFKAEQATVDAVTRQVDQHELSIAANAQAITARLTSTQVDSLVSAKGYVNQAQLTATSTAWSLALTQVSTDLSNLEIGGRNLVIRNDEWKNRYLTGSETYPNPSSSAGNSTSTMRELISVIPGENLMFTKNSAGDDYWRVSWLNSSKGYVSRFVNTSNKFMMSVPSGIAYMWVSYPTDSKPKVEKGTKATDWTPAPEDMATLEQFTTIDATVKGLQITVGDKADETKVTQLANQWTQTTALVNGHTTQISSLGTQIDLRVVKGDVIGQITVEAGRTLIKNGQLVLDANTYIMGTTFANDIKAKSLDAVYADIATLKTKVLTADVITSTMLKSDTALIDKIFINDANVQRFTAKTAFINSVKAIDIAADRINTGTLNAAKVTIINLDASRITTGVLNGIKITSPFNYSYDGAIMNSGFTTIANGEITMNGNFTHAYGGTFLKINPDTIYAENLQASGAVRSMFKLSGVGLELNVLGKTAKYTQDGIYFESGGNASVKYNSGDARIEISSYNGVALGTNSSGTFYYRISTGGGQDGLAPFVDIWTDLNLRSTLNVMGNTVKNAAHITGVKDILFANTSNRIVQGSDNILNIMSPAQINMGYTNGTITSNSLIISNWGTQFTKQVHFNGNQINGASNIRGVKTILFDGSSNRIVQDSNGYFNILAPIQLNLGWTDGTSTFNTMVITQNQAVIRRTLNMDGNSISNQSDRRLKKDIVNSERTVVDSIKKWNFVEYYWKGSDKPSGNQFGLIAQDTPELMIFEEEDDYYGINISRQIMLNSKGVQELAFKNDEQDSRVDDLEEKIKELETIIREMGK